MTRFVLTLLALAAPMAATSSLNEDVAYWRAVRTWEQISPGSYYAYAAVVVTVFVWVVRWYRPRIGT